MPAKLVITKKSDPEWKMEETFAEALITIGRNNENLLFLEDPEKALSRYHAEIKLNDGKYFVNDCNSANSTYVNEQKIGTEPFTLNDEDVVRVGDFLITFKQIVIPEPSEEEDRTRIYENPFLAEMNQLVDLVGDIQKKYDDESPDSRQAVLDQALKDIMLMHQLDAGEVGEALAGALCSKSNELPNNENPPQKIVQEETPKFESAPIAHDAPNQSSVIDLLIDSILEIVRNAAQFRSEFIDLATFVSQFPLHLTTTDDLKNYLFDTKISPHEADLRFQNIKAQITELLVHHKGMKKGYKALVGKGAEGLLQFLDPSNLERHFANEPLFKLGNMEVKGKIIPFYPRFKAMSEYKQMLADLREDGQVAFDRKIFRPSFVHAYMEAMSAAGQDSKFLTREDTER